MNGTIKWTLQYINARYIPKALERLQHMKPKKPQYAPLRWTTAAYGQSLQMVPEPYSSPLLGKKDPKFIQSVVGKLLYYTRLLDPTMLCGINEISRVQYKPTTDTLEKARILLDYASTYSSSILCSHASQMIIHVDSDSEYLVMPKSRSCYAGYFYLSDWPRYKSHKPTPWRNGPILTACKKIRNVLTSAAEAETTGAFNNAKEGVGIRPSLFAPGNEQPATPLKTDNFTTADFFNSGMKPKRSKTWDMRMH